MKLLSLLALLMFLPSCRLFKSGKKEQAQSSESGAAPEESNSLPPAKAIEASKAKRLVNASCRAWAKPAEVPALLSQTGCFESNDPKKAIAALIPYEVALSFWSDGVDKQRWLALPDDRMIGFSASGALQLPRGSVLIKEFARAGKRIETRFLVRQADGDWSGYTYEWNEAQTDAHLVPTSGKALDNVAGEPWTFPSADECIRCHNQAAGSTLGWDILQLNRLTSAVSGLKQISYFQTLKVIEPDPTGATLPRPSLKLDGSLEERARAYLHVNCAMCHRPGGPTPSSIDLRYGTELSQMKICDLPPTIDDLGIADARLIKPQSPESSVIVHRMSHTDYSRMPPIGSHKIDADGVALISEWIKGLTSCPQ